LLLSVLVRDKVFDKNAKKQHPVIQTLTQQCWYALFSFQENLLENGKADEQSFDYAQDQLAISNRKARWLWDQSALQTSGTTSISGSYKGYPRDIPEMSPVYSADVPLLIKAGISQAYD
jgi:hypothetical protein